MSFTLYYFPGTCALATFIALEDCGAPYTPHRIDFNANEQRAPAYRALNPKGRVPALATPRGVLTETPAILAFIAQSFPEAQLAPLDDPFAFAEAQAFNAYLCATVHVAHAHIRRGARWADEESSYADMQRVAPRAIGEAYAPIESGMLKGPFVLGARYSICDAYLFTMSSWLDRDKVDTSKLPRIQAHRALMNERPSVRKALAAAQT